MSITSTKAKGLYTSDNPLGSVPDGALKQADNVVITSNDVVEPRRGQEKLSYTVASGIPPEQMFFYGDTLMVVSNDTLYHDTGSAFTALSGTIVSPDPINLRVQAAESNGNLYVTSDEGVKVLDSASATPTDAGVQSPTDKVNAVDLRSVQSSGGWMTYNKAVAYRFVWGRRDANANVKLSPPSGRYVVTNRLLVAVGGATRDTSTTPDLVTVTTQIPHGLAAGDTVTLAYTGAADANFPVGAKTVADVPTSTTFRYEENGVAGPSTEEMEFTTDARSTSVTFGVPSDADEDTWFYRVYRTVMSESASADPGDECYLAYEGAPSSADVTNGYITVNDITPESFLADPLYTNERTGDGILNANERPPLAHDLAVWQDRLWYANTTSRHQATIQIIGVSSTGGATAALTIWDIDTGNSISFSVTKTTTGLPSENVEKTARSLVQDINSDGSNTLYDAFYISTANTPPGLILVRERGFGGSGFGFSQSASFQGVTWSPSPLSREPVSAASSNDRLQNGLFYSKIGEPEAVPLLNYLTVGPKNRAIRKIAPLKDKLFVFKEEGIYTVSGQYPFSVDLLDNTTRIVAADSVAELNGQLYALTNQGVVAVSDTGVQIVSKPIEKDIVTAIEDIGNPGTTCFGLGYQTERSYLLWLEAGGANGYAFVYNALTRAWTKWPITRSCGAISLSSDRLCLGSSTDGSVFRERKDFAATDYSDEDLSVTISSSSGTSVTLSSATGVSEGDLLVQGATTAHVTEVSGNTLTLNRTETWSAGAATIKKAYECEVRWNVQTAGAPGLEKHFPQFQMHFKNADFTTGTATFSSDKNADEVEVTLSGAQGFGDNTWDAAWGDTEPEHKNFREHVPLEHQRASYLTMGFKTNEARANWLLNGFTLEADGMSERTKK